MFFRRLSSASLSVSSVFLLHLITALTTVATQNVTAVSNTSLNATDNANANNGSNAEEGSSLLDSLFLAISLGMIGVLSVRLLVDWCVNSNFRNALALAANPPNEQDIRIDMEPQSEINRRFEKRCNKYRITPPPLNILDDLTDQDIQRLMESKNQHHILLAKTYLSLQAVVYLNAVCPITLEELTPEKTDFVIAIQQCNKKRMPSYCLAENKSTLFKSLAFTGWHLPTVGRNDKYLVKPSNTVINVITFIDNKPTFDYLETKKKECRKALASMVTVSENKCEQGRNAEEVSQQSLRTNRWFCFIPQFCQHNAEDVSKTAPKQNI